jgi:hypothetical protein
MSHTAARTTGDEGRSCPTPRRIDRLLLRGLQRPPGGRTPSGIFDAFLLDYQHFSYKPGGYLQ